MLDRRSFVVGLDLGQVKDYTAVAVLEKVGDVLEAPHLERFPLGTPYPAVVDRVATILATPPLAGSSLTLVVDETGVGRPVVDLIRQYPRIRCPVVAVVITGGVAVSEDGVERRYTVPKRDLVATVQALLQTKQLKVASALPEADALVKELLAFQVKVSTAANDSYGAWREGTHDDLVLAVALAAWWARRPGAFFRIRSL